MTTTQKARTARKPSPVAPRTPVDPKEQLDQAVAQLRSHAAIQVSTAADVVRGFFAKSDRTTTEAGDASNMLQQLEWKTDEAMNICHTAHFNTRLLKMLEIGTPGAVEVLLEGATADAQRTPAETISEWAAMLRREMGYFRPTSLSSNPSRNLSDACKFEAARDLLDSYLFNAVTYWAEQVASQNVSFS